jgi:NAD(P)H dehydrogenase (quinone)
MSIVITGATGHLGRLVVERLLDDGTPAGDIIATGRDLSRLEPLAARGVTTRRADFADPAQLEVAFAGAGRLLLVSTTDIDERFDNHRRAIDAARAVGVTQLVYISMLNASTAGNRLAEEHHRTEEYLRNSGVPFVLLRNGWYLENYTDQLPQITEHGALLGSARDGRVSGASRRDYAAATSAVLTQDGHTGATYELGGEPFTMAELAATISQELSAEITYQDLPVAAYADVLTRAGLPPELANVLADADAGLARGELFTDSDDLPRLIDRPATTRQEAVRAALAHSAA